MITFDLFTLRFPFSEFVEKALKNDNTLNQAVELANLTRRKTVVVSKARKKTNGPSFKSNDGTVVFLSEETFKQYVSAYPGDVMDVINLFSITPKKRISANDEMVSIFVEKMAVYAKQKRKFCLHRLTATRKTTTTKIMSKMTTTKTWRMSLKLNLPKLVSFRVKLEFHRTMIELRIFYPFLEIIRALQEVMSKPVSPAKMLLEVL